LIAALKRQQRAVPTAIPRRLSRPTICTPTRLPS